MLFMLETRMKADKMKSADITAGTRNKVFQGPLREYTVVLVISAEIFADFPQSALHGVGLHK